MRLKILLLPFFIIVILTLSIGYIKPDFDIVIMKRAEIASKEAQEENMKSVIENINSLISSLDAEQGTEQFMYRYLPNTLNQEQVIDAFNLLAIQSGLAITKMELKLPIRKIADEPLVDPVAQPFVAGGKVFGNVDSIVPVPLVVARTFIFKGSVAGSYENIKAFFDHLTHIERFQEMRFFSIEISGNIGEQKIEASDNLIGTFEVKYGYLPSKPIASALNMPVFLESRFDFSNANTLLSKITSPIQTLEKGETGKPNPFQ